MNIFDDPRLDWPFLEKYGFDRDSFASYATKIANGTLDKTSTRFTGTIEPAPHVTDVGKSHPAARERGEAALRAGQVAVVVLNGGMATRFGNVVKGTVEVFDEKSFIALKAEDVRRASDSFGAQVPFVLMNSFATNSATREHLENNGHFGLDPAQISMFEQSISIRMNPDGSLFVGSDDKPSYHAPGHGDFFRCLRASGVLASLLERGVETIAFSNVDNLGATVDPTVLGLHLESGASMTAEVTAKRRTASGNWDKGGAPCVADGKLQLMEGFRFPPDMAPTFLPDFSTNNFWFATKDLDRDIPLAKHVVEKKVDGKPALQLESITCEASAIYEDDRALLPLNLLRVARDGDNGRFFPVKEKVDLEALRSSLKARLESGWAQRDQESA